MNAWVVLITSLPAENARVRMKAWRGVKGLGVAVLRDGVYLLPDRDECRRSLEAVAHDIRAVDGMALVARIEQPTDGDFAALFDRGADFAVLLDEISAAREALNPATAHEVQKLARKLRKAFTNLVGIDFFSGESQKQTEQALQDLELRVALTLAPDEPHPVHDPIVRLNVQDYQGRIWATRQRPWVDRLASAWLIRRYIDPQARLVWLPTPADCPRDGVGFDFDGATFTHVGARVTFEVLLASFGLYSPSLQRMATLVHYLDVGGVQPPEAIGIEKALAGLRDTVHDDERLFEIASKIFDGLLASFEKSEQS